jgi:SAM-dependent methyltransferase
MDMPNIAPMVRHGSVEAADSYRGDWYASGLARALESPERVVPHLIELIAPRSVVDVGCGPGSWLESFTDHGVDDVLGVEGEWLDTTVLRIPRDRMKIHDLTTPLRLDRGFDLALSLEVGEHLPPSAAPELVRTLTRLAPVIAFSAAAPLQGGTHHLNERWPDYWAGLFAERGFAPLDSLRPRIWLDRRVAWYYRQNTFLAVCEDVLERHPILREEYARSGGRVLPLVHPDRYLRIAPSSLARVKDDALGMLDERWPAARSVRSALKGALARARTTARR